MTRAISWAAVSSHSQAERESPHDQNHLNHFLAEALGWEIAEDITVPGESRSYYRLSDARANIEAYHAWKSSSSPETPAGSSARTPPDA